MSGAATAHSIFSSLLTRYREQMTDLDATDDQDEIDRLADASEETLEELVSIRPNSAALLAEKIDTLIARNSDYGVLRLDLLRELGQDAHHLASEPGIAQAWTKLWHDIGGWLIAHPGEHRYYGLPEPLTIREDYTASLPVSLKLQNEAEAIGAAKTLQALLRLAGKRAADHVFAFASVPPVTASPASPEDR